MLHVSIDQALKMQSATSTSRALGSVRLFEQYQVQARRTLLSVEDLQHVSQPTPGLVRTGWVHVPS